MINQIRTSCMHDWPLKKKTELATTFDKIYHRILKEKEKRNVTTYNIIPLERKLNRNREKSVPQFLKLWDICFCCVSNCMCTLISKNPDQTHQKRLSRLAEVALLKWWLFLQESFVMQSCYYLYNSLYLLQNFYFWTQIFYYLSSHVSLKL